MNNIIANELYSIILNIHKKYGKIASDRSKEWIQDTEIYYALCKFFTLDERAINLVFKSKEKKAEYVALMGSVEELLQNEVNKQATNFKLMKEFLDDAYLTFFAKLEPYQSKDTKPISMQELSDVFFAIDGENGSAEYVLYSFIEEAIYRLKQNSMFGDVCKHCNKNLQEGKDSAKQDLVNYHNRNKLLELKDSLNRDIKSKIKGQDMAVEKFVDSYMRYKIRGKEKGKPAVVSLFAGPPGMGKTYLAETFAELLKSQGYEYKRFDMSAYSSDSGDAATGLVGFEKTWSSSQPGQLTDFVRKHPKCVLLFDEIEKASSKVRLVFLSVLEGATLTDRYYDCPVSFEDAIIIFTTNEGKEIYKNNHKANLTAMADTAVIDGLSHSKFPPELLSRFAAGNIIMFNYLDHNHILEIFKSNLEYAVSRIQSNSNEFEFEYAKDTLAKLYMYNKGGYVDARYVSANVRKYVEDEYMYALEFISDSGHNIDCIKKISVNVELRDDIKPYFELTDKPRVLCFANCEKLSYKNTLSKLVELDWVNSVEAFEERLDGCNWHSNKAEDKYSAILISIFEKSEEDTKYIDTQGYQCLLSVMDRGLELPVMVEENVSKGKSKALDKDTKKNLRGHGVTDFVDIYSEEFVKTLSRYDFFSRANSLSKADKIITADKKYSYNAKSEHLKISFTNLVLAKASEELLYERVMNERYLLANRPQVGLKDIFGNRLAKEAVKRCIDNIKHPDRYLDKGARLVKGILMYGAPGMGKTMFAKAMAFESGAEFISTVGSDFTKSGGVERLEEIFQTARRKKPCIIFIDEFDVISKRRGNSNNPNNEEKVLNKFLKEMDGLETNNEGVYVIGATNYNVEDLDPAVTRRFSSKIYFPCPNRTESREYLKYILRKKGFKNVLSSRAAKTLSLMMFGHMDNFSEIETFVEEAISEAVYRGVPLTERFLFNRVHEVTNGIVRSSDDIVKLTATAYHEAGHAVLQWYYGKQNEYVTIVSRGRYSGYALADTSVYTREEFLEAIRISLAGRIAEMRFYGSDDKANNAGVNVGAQNDLKKATNIAYDFVARMGYGSRMAVVPERFGYEGMKCLENILPEKEQEAIWDEVNALLAVEWDNTKRLLDELWDKAQAIANSLVFMKELDGETIDRIMETGIPQVDESCFDDRDRDYAFINTVKEKDIDENCIDVTHNMKYPYGYSIFPRSLIRGELKYKEHNIEEGKTYYYAVKDSKNSWGIYEDLHEAFALAYKKRASCRRFISKEVAEQYLSSLELMVSKINGECKIRFKVDGLDELFENRFEMPELKILDQAAVDEYRKAAAAKGISLDEYFVRYVVNKRIIESTKDFQVFYLIYDQELKSMIAQVWD